MAVTTPRRYYLLKSLAAIAAGDEALADVWRFKQLLTPWPALPSNFPARAKLIAASYETVRDLDGAEEHELLGLGLTRTESASVLAEMEHWTMIPTLLKSPSVQMQNGEFAEIYNAPLIPSAARTASGTGETFEMGDLSALDLLLDVTAASGTLPTLDVKVQCSYDGVTEWQDFITFGQKTAVSHERQGFAGASRFARAVWTITGTNPSFTFSLGGDAK